MPDTSNLRLSAYNAAIATPGVTSVKLALEAATSILAFLSGNEAAAPTTSTRGRAGAKAADAAPAAETSASSGGATDASDAAGFDASGVEISVDDFRASCAKWLEANGKALGGDEKAQQRLAEIIAPAERLSLVPASEYGAIMAKLSEPVGTAAKASVFD